MHFSGISTFTLLCNLVITTIHLQNFFILPNWNYVPIKQSPLSPLSQPLPAAILLSISMTSVQLLSHVWLFVTSWTTACQASLSITNSQSLLNLMSIEWVTLSNHLILCHPLLLLSSIFASIRVFSNESVLRIRWPNIGASASASVFPINIQDRFPLGLTGLISWQSKSIYMC